MNIVITMAGRGSRFKQRGISTPKHRIDVDGEPIFRYAMRSLTDFFDERFVFVSLDDRDDPSFLADECATLGIDEYDVVEVPEVTAGQATTVLEADQLLDDDDPLSVYNIDTYVEPGTIRADAITGDGWIPVFETEGEHWSFVERDENGQVSRVAEKQRISPYATLGFYYFDAFADFRAAYNARRDDVVAEFGETYIAPLYQHLIEQNRRVVSELVDGERIHVLGTPEEVAAFYPPFQDEHDL